MTAESQFLALRAKWQAAHDKADTFRRDLLTRYPAGLCYAPKGKRDQLDRYHATANAIAERFYTLLDTISPRDWRSGVPCHWVLATLTFTDATTAAQLSVIPPPAWGHTSQDMTAFAWAVRSERIAS